MIRLAYIVSHPIQYQAPLLRRLALEPKLDLTVLFLSDFSTREYLDPGFGKSISWDVNLLDGYKFKVLDAWGNRDRLGFWRPYTIGIERELRQGEYDAVWLHGYAHHAQIRALVAARRLGTKVLLRGESHDKSSDRSPLLSAVKRQILGTLFRHIDAFLAIGTANRDYYLGHGVAAGKIFMMPYAVDNVSFQASATPTSRLKLLSELGLRPDRPVILFASKMQARKRPGDLWEAYTKLSSNGVDEPWPYLIFAGEGDQRAELEAAVAKRCWDSVRFVGFQNQTKIPAYYAAADVFVLPSEREPWGLVVNEAMNAGRAVIVSDQVGANADLVEDGVNGYVVPVGDVDTLTKRLQQITSDRALATSMGASSLRNISQWDFEADVAGLHEALVGCGIGATTG
jgi:glycosyltransferase involved in cell wall biosynthesis